MLNYFFKVLVKDLSKAFNALSSWSGLFLLEIGRPGPYCRSPCMLLNLGSAAAEGADVEVEVDEESSGATAAEGGGGGVGGGGTMGCCTYDGDVACSPVGFDDSTCGSTAASI